MSRILTLELNEQAYAVLQQQAEAAGVTPAALAARVIEGHSGPSADIRTEVEKQRARERFRRHAGAVSLGYPAGTDNEGIDADLAREAATALSSVRGSERTL